MAVVWPDLLTLKRPLKACGGTLWISRVYGHVSRCVYERRHTRWNIEQTFPSFFPISKSYLLLLLLLLLLALSFSFFFEEEGGGGRGGEGKESSESLNLLHSMSCMEPRMWFLFKGKFCRVFVDCCRLKWFIWPSYLIWLDWIFFFNFGFQNNIGVVSFIFWLICLFFGDQEMDDWFNSWRGFEWRLRFDMAALGSSRRPLLCPKEFHFEKIHSM